MHRLAEAERVIRNCFGNKGIWASPSRYRHQCWTRDFVVSQTTLFDLGLGRTARTHLESLASRQQKDGKIPILFADDWLRLFSRKACDSLRNHRLSYVLQGMLGSGIEELSPWTTDPEMQFIIGVMEYAQNSGDHEFLERYQPHLASALSHVEQHSMRHGLAVGGDWRDMLLHLKDKALLTNNAFLYRAYDLLGETTKAKRLEDVINREFWNGSCYTDFPGAPTFDTLGQSLAVLFGIVPPERYSSVIEQYKRVEAPCGYRINDFVPAPQTPEEQQSVQLVMQKTNQYRTLWPFVHGFAILAMEKMGERDVALEHFRRWNRLDGFYEWYDAETGAPHGSDQQLWSAALYLEAAKALKNSVGQ